MITLSTWSGIRGIVLDAVGTLIEPSPPVAEVYAEAGRRQGIVIEPGVVKARFHQQFRQDESAEAQGPMATDERSERLRWRRIVAQVLAEVPNPERAFLELWEHFGQASAWRCFADVEPALRSFRTQRLGLRIASNFDARLRAVVAGLPELAPCGDDLVISSAVGFRKPHPAFFQAACASQGLPPERVLSIGDDPELDVRGASRAGLQSVLLDRTGDKGDDLPKVRDLLELAQLLLDRGQLDGD